MCIRALSVCCGVLVCVSLVGCVWAPMLETRWGENFALAPYGTVASHPSLNDGNLDTEAIAYPVEGERIFTLKFEEPKPVNKIIIHNKNLYRFDVERLDLETGEWKTFHEVRQRRDIGKERYQAKYIIDQLNFHTDTIRMVVSRTVDDRVSSRYSVGPTDKVIGQYRGARRGQTLDYYRVIEPSLASIREIEIYHLAPKE